MSLCIAPSLIEQDVFEFLFDLRDSINKMLSSTVPFTIFEINNELNLILLAEVNIKQKLVDELSRVRRPEVFV